MAFSACTHLCAKPAAPFRGILMPRSRLDQPKLDRRFTWACKLIRASDYLYAACPAGFIEATLETVFSGLQPSTYLPWTAPRFITKEQTTRLSWSPSGNTYVAVFLWPSWQPLGVSAGNEASFIPRLSPDSLLKEPSSCSKERHRLAWTTSSLF